MSYSDTMKPPKNVRDDFGVVLKLTKKDGSQTDLLIRANDDPLELASKYATSAGLSTKVIAKLAKTISDKRNEALAEYDIEVARTRTEESPIQSPYIKSNPFHLQILNSANTTPVVSTTPNHQPQTWTANDDEILSSTASQSALTQISLNGRLESPSGVNRGVTFGDLTVVNELEYPVDLAVSHSENTRSASSSPRGVRLYEEQHKKQERHRRLSITIEAEKQAAIDATSFIKQKSPLSQSSSPRSASREELEVMAAERYDRGMRRLSLKEQAMDRIRIEKEAERAKEDVENTFQPKLFTSSKKSQLLTSRRQSVVGSPRSVPTSPSSAQSHAPTSPSASSESASPVGRFDVATSTISAPSLEQLSPESGSPVVCPAPAHVPTPPSPDVLPEDAEATPQYDLNTAFSAEALVWAHVERGRSRSVSRMHQNGEALSLGTHDRHARSHSPRSLPSVPASEASNIVDWLYYQSVEDQKKARLALEDRIRKEREARMPFQPHVHEYSARLALKKREQKLQRYSEVFSSGISNEHQVKTEVQPQTQIQQSNMSRSPRKEGTPMITAPLNSDLSRDGSSDDPLTLSQLAMPSPTGTDAFGETSDVDTVSTNNPFDMPAAQLSVPAAQSQQGEALSYSPHAYERALRANKQSAKISSTLSPKSRADELFNSLYNGRLDTEIARRAAAEKHSKHYSFSPKLSAYGENVQIETNQEEFCARLHKTPTRASPIGEVVKCAVIDTKTEERLVKRMFEDYPKKTRAAVEQRRLTLRNSQRTASSICHEDQPVRMADLTCHKREKSLSEIFDVLLLSAAYWHHSQAQNQDESNQSEALNARESSTIQAMHSDDETSASEQLLDTLHAQTQFLEPKDLCDAMEIVMRDARPARLTRAAFIHRCETMIKSGTGPPINAILLAPQRQTRNKSSDDLQADELRAPHLAARRMSERMNSRRGFTSSYRQGYDPKKYVREQAAKREMLAQRAACEESKHCTFAPDIQTAYTWKDKVHQHDRRESKDVVISRQSSKTVVKPFKRTVHSPTASSLFHRSPSLSDLSSARAPSPRERALAAAAGSPLVSPATDARSPSHSASPKAYSNGHPATLDLIKPVSRPWDSPQLTMIRMQDSAEDKHFHRADLGGDKMQAQECLGSRFSEDLVEAKHEESDVAGGEQNRSSNIVHDPSKSLSFSCANETPSLRQLSSPRSVTSSVKARDSPHRSFGHQNDRNDLLTNARREAQAAESAARAAANSPDIPFTGSPSIVGDGKRSDEQLERIRLATESDLRVHEAHLLQHIVSITSMLGDEASTAQPRKEASLSELKSAETPSPEIEHVKEPFLKLDSGSQKGVLGISTEPSIQAAILHDDHQVALQEQRQKDVQAPHQGVPSLHSVTQASGDSTQAPIRDDFIDDPVQESSSSTESIHEVPARSNAGRRKFLELRSRRNRS